MFRFNVSILRMRYSQDRISIFIEFSKTCNRTKFNFVIDNAPISVGGRVLKGSLKEALKGAKGASTITTNGESSKETKFDEILSSINMFLVTLINLIACVTCL